MHHRVSFGVDAPYLAQFQRLYRAGDLRPVADHHPGDAVRVELLGGDAGVYIERPDGSLRFRWVRAPISTELAGLTQTLARRIGRYFERQGLLERDAENSYFAGDVLESRPMEQFLGSSITYRIAGGPQQGRKVFTIQTLPACDEPFDAGIGKVGGGSPCTPVWRRGRINGRSSSGCVATSAGRPSRKSACR